MYLLLEEVTLFVECVKRMVSNVQQMKREEKGRFGVHDATWWQQATGASKGKHSEVPVCIWRGDRREDQVALPSNHTGRGSKKNMAKTPTSTNARCISIIKLYTADYTP